MNVHMEVNKLNVDRSEHKYVHVIMLEKHSIYSYTMIIYGHAHRSGFSSQIMAAFCGP